MVRSCASAIDWPKCLLNASVHALLDSSPLFSAIGLRRSNDAWTCFSKSWDIATMRTYAEPITSFGTASPPRYVVSQKPRGAPTTFPYGRASFSVSSVGGTYGLSSRPDALSAVG